ncbi:MAG: DUF3060 domain-containing protein [Chloroflexi bacterium]|nr:MAG: DUF3060 domain-containing protein [Chloroflexota bacterium]
MKRRFVFVILAFVLTTIIIAIPLLRRARGGVIDVFGVNQIVIASINPDPFNPMAILDTGEYPAVAEDPKQNCTYSDYYWVEHTERWPNTIVINEQRYTREEGYELISTNNNEISARLLRSLFVAYLNIYKGADMSQIEDTVKDSEVWLAGTPDDALLSNFRRQMGVTLAANLNAYINGLYGPGLCPDQPEPPVPTSTPTTPAMVSPTATNQLRMFLENLFSRKDQTPTPTSAPTVTETNTSQPPANNPAPPPPENNPAPQPTITSSPPQTDTQPPSPTDTELPPTYTAPPPPTETASSPPTDTQTTPPDVGEGPGQIIISNNQNETINCSGAEVIVEGNNNTLTLLGVCSSLSVYGNHNQISLEAPTSITDTGNNNNIVIQ